MVAAGEADALLAGATSRTSEVILAAETIIGRRAGVATTSSFFLVETADGRPFVFADCAVNVEPDAAELASIGVLAAEGARALLDTPPRVAFLSCSTKGSAEHPRIDRVREATTIARRLAPGVAIDGELQADAAIDGMAARHKLAAVGPVAGQANVLIFPDLDAGNIAYKLVRDLGRATAIGVVLQGFRRPVIDVSRGADPMEIESSLVLLAALCGPQGDGCASVVASSHRG